MSYKELTDTITQLFTQRYEAVNVLIEGLKGKIGKDVPNEAIVATFITLATELANFYRFSELEWKMIVALQGELEIVGMEAFKTRGEKETRELTDTLSAELTRVIRDTTRNWNQ
jgi:hypothetical protein